MRSLSQRSPLRTLRERLLFKLTLAVGLILLISLSLWGYFNVRQQRQQRMQAVMAATDRLSHTIRLGTHYAMMLNSRDDIRQIINNIARLEDIASIRIYDKSGVIQFSNRSEDLGTATNIKAEACFICHRQEPPTVHLGLNARKRIFHNAANQRMLGVISPIYNEPGCSTDDCHVHPADKKVLGALDLVVPLGSVDRETAEYQRKFILLAGLIFAVTLGMIWIFFLRFINQPIRSLIQGTRHIEQGQYHYPIDVAQSDEMGQLAEAIFQMGEAISAKEFELNRQRDEYQNLFEQVPCIVTVQDRNFRLIGYNREFAEKFNPSKGCHCYEAYKGRTEKCLVCPVERTFADGQSHYSEESGVDKDGTPKHWLVKTAPIRNTRGEVVAAMEMNLDISERKNLETRLERSEKKYHDIFNNIPNPVFVLDRETLEILDCNSSAEPLYGYPQTVLVGRSFLTLFAEDGERWRDTLQRSQALQQVKHLTHDGQRLFVNMRLSPSEYPGREALLVTISDVTKRLETEQQLIHASKMATLGEMATGVAHELNQPLAVIKTASSFFMKKVKKEQAIDPEVLATLSIEVDSHVDRATKIINHMRQFGRMRDPELSRVSLNNVLRRAFEIFHQQLKVRGIEVTWQLTEELPDIMGDADRLEQVMINLLINARDAIEEDPTPDRDKAIEIATWHTADQVCCRVCDSGVGIPPAVASKIFDPFYTTKKVGKGTGLGLSISYGIVKECGGTIQAEESALGGACFVCRFPHGETTADEATS
ncbi:MAG: PAS domain S-box protein [Desulfosarcinaceae bacterium]|nr:PAS domain S-box protein [Desulfosarcinaceae bacterium]